MRSSCPLRQLSENAAGRGSTCVEASAAEELAMTADYITLAVFAPVDGPDHGP